MSGESLTIGLGLALAQTTGPLQTVVGVTPATLAGALTAVVGLFVAYQAFRGYRRNDSRPMLFLGLGIFLVTALPFVVTTALAGPLGASDAVAVLAWTVLEILGLGSILYALTGA
ncbi:hypothetical protein ACFQMA_03245 [Halosimplex aquaticum]|uniref:Uncharacterized protein n=1 Tax=Halosimplex aquaticum TaxID=3026162 RepID=A0ABD5XZL9_9EURY|nr:hypothetical protein [Halosimplex aquaticum]